MEDTKRSSQRSMTTKSEKEKDTRQANIQAAIAVADVVRTSLGPRGMDKMIEDAQGQVLITNDGATILKKIQVIHPTGKMLVEMSKAQDIEAGDGTTSVAVIAGSLLTAAKQLMAKGIHPSIITDGYQLAVNKASNVIDSIAIPIKLEDTEALIQNAKTSLASKVVAQYADVLAPIAAQAVMGIYDKENPNVDLKDIKIVKKLGGTIEEAEIIDGVILGNNKASRMAGGPTKMENAKIAVVQFCISPPKTDMDHSLVVSNDAAMDRVIEQEKKYILRLVKKIAEQKCNVLFIQKSILRDAITELGLHFLAKKKIMVVKDIEREDVDFICKSINATPIAHIDQFSPDKLGQAKLCEEVDLGENVKMIKITGAEKKAKTLSVLLRGSSSLILDESERSLHDALCVIRSLVKKPSMVAGGGAVETELVYKLNEYANELTGAHQFIVRAYASALEIIPYTLAENAGLIPINIVTEMKNRHAQGEVYLGLNIKKGMLEDTYKENIIQPSLVTYSAINLATECVRSILKVDEVVLGR